MLFLEGISSSSRMLLAELQAYVRTSHYECITLCVNAREILEPRGIRTRNRGAMVDIMTMIMLLSRSLNSLWLDYL